MVMTPLARQYSFTGITDTRHSLRSKFDIAGVTVQVKHVPAPTTTGWSNGMTPHFPTESLHGEPDVQGRCGFESRTGRIRGFFLPIGLRLWYKDSVKGFGVDDHTFVVHTS